jgi:methylase of polypeptide subunit release factors
MNQSLVTSKLTSLKPVKNYPLNFAHQEVFSCPEESKFYSQCIDRMVLTASKDFTSVIEFGAGDGSPVINSLLKNQFNGVINGYELNPQAYAIAKSWIEIYKLESSYKVHNSCFNAATNGTNQSDFLIANPPYLPAIDNDLYIPALHGGTDGAAITKQLFLKNFPNAMLMVSSYSDPVGTVETAIAQGYQVEDFITSPMSFGYYSSEPKVKQRITELNQLGRAFYSDNIYILAGVLFKKSQKSKIDLSKELIKVMTAL